MSFSLYTWTETLNSRVRVMWSPKPEMIFFATQRSRMMAYLGRLAGTKVGDRLLD